MPCLVIVLAIAVEWRKQILLLHCWELEGKHVERPRKQWMIDPNSVGFSEDKIIPLVLVIVVSERRHSKQLGKDAGGVLNGRDEE